AVFSRAPRAYGSDDRESAGHAAELIVEAAKNARLYEKTVEDYQNTLVLHRISRIVNSMLDLGELLNTACRTCCEHISARGAVLQLLDPKTRRLEVHGSYGVDAEEVARAVREAEHGTTCRVLMEGKPRVKVEPDGERCLIDAAVPDCASLVCAPLISRGTIIGTLTVFDRVSPFRPEPIPFDEGDVGLISTIGSHIAMAIENARLFGETTELARENEMRAREMSLLFEITNVMRSFLDLDEMLYMILTSVTMGQGFGFNRAFLFMMDDDDRELSGKIAVGPLRPEEASQYWLDLGIDGKPLAEVMRDYSQYNMRAGFAIDRMIKEVTIPVRTDAGILARTVREKRVFNVSGYAAPEGSAEFFLRDARVTSFAVVPLTAKERVAGVMVVDNLVTRKPITDDDLTFLLLFANQAASAIEMAKVYTNLELTNKRLMDARDMLVRQKTLATLGEFSAGIAHELRNPLVSIGGFSKRLLKLLPDNSREANYAKIIATEVEGLEKILGQILEFVAGARVERRKTDAEFVINQVLALMRKDISGERVAVKTTFDERARFLLVDEMQFRQLFINLIKNAVEAMKGRGGTLGISSALIEDEEGGVGFEVSDTGDGISPEDIGRIFDPFFTRKPAGTGLGLPICSRIVETNHGGRIFVDSKKGHGTSVLLWFPWSAIVREAEPGGGREQGGR
ncbi:MAG: GAF domain-containing protein, partial [bacterium]